jgi:hypothetical protein
VRLNASLTGADQRRGESRAASAAHACTELEAQAMARVPRRAGAQRAETAASRVSTRERTEAIILMLKGEVRARLMSLRPRGASDLQPPARHDRAATFGSSHSVLPTYSSHLYRAGKRNLGRS